MNTLSALFSKVDYEKAINKIDNGLILDNPSPIDLVDFYKIMVLFEQKENLNNPYSSELQKRISILKEIKRALNIYFKEYTSIKFLEDVRAFDNDENSHEVLDFFNLICKENVFEKLDEIGIDYLLKRIPLHVILKQQKFSSTYEEKIKGIFLAYPECIEFIINKYDMKDGGNYYLPELNDDEINEMIMDYLSCEYCNYKYLRSLKLHRDSKDSYTIKRKVRLAINNKIDEWISKLRNTGVSIHREFGIVFDEKQDEPVKFIDNGSQQIISISIAFFNADLSESGVLTRVRDLCGFIDEQGRIRVAYNPRKESSLSLALTSKNKDEYGSNIFYHLDSINTLMIKSLYENYIHRKIHLEQIIDWVINSQFKEKYHIDGFKSNLYIDGDYQVKCEHLFNELSSFINQFRIYAEEGELTPELINVTKDSFKIGDIPSLNKNKYVELNNNHELNLVFYLVFSNQSPLAYISEDYYANNFAELIYKYRLRKDQFLNFQQKGLDTLIKHGIIKSSEYIELADVKIFSIIKDLYDNNFITYSCLTRDYQVLIDDLVKKEWLKYSSKLFSLSESDYLDYYLNNSKFSNALALRNKYEHGSTSHFTNAQNQENYIMGLKCYFIVLFKIMNDVEIKMYCKKDDERQ